MTTAAAGVEAVVPAGELGTGAARRVTVAGTEVLLVRLPGDRVVAFAAACPHQRTDLEGATFCDGRVRCPLHSYEYDLGTGENVVPARDLDPDELRKAAPGQLTVYPVEERDGWIWVAARPGPPPSAEPVPRPPGEVVTVAPGTTFELRLPAPARPGFVWRVEVGSALLAVVGERRERGEHLVRLAARAAGRSSVRCLYARPWDREPVETRAYQVEIEARFAAPPPYGGRYS